MARLLVLSKLFFSIQNNDYSVLSFVHVNEAANKKKHIVWPAHSVISQLRLGKSLLLLSIGNQMAAFVLKQNAAVDFEEMSSTNQSGEDRLIATTLTEKSVRK
ncbi:hypothetical protein AVEN_100630-1 [Araneus ventricosus]|uniref:Uncharacterized protein n=1 Tax=Araneus ventricosus TaxID=182803 RepID=A0A4Y2SF33_ARAVE|nr:hypothetical protein AVEN_236345-1 [Araneus ventricosus]GBN86858.1 hypothetical protein AVEN_100630-1 [Araneus ventricosus]